MASKKPYQLNFTFLFHFQCTIMSALPTLLAILPTILAKSMEAFADSSSSHLQMLAQSMQEDKFIISLINQDKFSDCSLLILQDRFDSGESVDRILKGTVSTSSSVKSSYSIKYSFPAPTDLETIPTTLPVQFKNSISNYRRRSSVCMIVIFMINDVRSAFMKEICNMLTPPFIPFTRKDEDFYIFKSRSKLHNRLLQMQELPSRIKFKIGVGSSWSESESSGERGNPVVNIRTVCFFCGTGGQPRIIDLPITENNLPRAGEDYFPDFVWDLNGKVLKVSLPFVRAKIEVDPPYEGTSNARRGNWKILFEEFLMIKFNCTYNMFVSTGMDGNKGGGGTGFQLKNQSWIGITGDLISGKADLGIVIANTPKRIRYIGFTDSFYDEGCLTFVTAQPTRIYSPLALLWPFDLGMWVGIGLSTVIGIIVFSAIVNILKLLNPGKGEKWTLSVQIQFLMSTFLDQASEVLPESPPLRSFVGLWIFFAMILTNVYRSKMVTLLAFPILGKLPKTFEELAFSDYQVGFMKHGDSAYNTLAASTDPVYKKLVDEMEVFSGVGLQCLEKVVKDKYACIAYNFAMVHLIERNLSKSDTRKLVFAPARTYNVWLGLGTEAKSIYRINFGKVLAYTRPYHLATIWDKMDMYHKVRKLKFDWWTKTNHTDKVKQAAQEESDNLTLKHIVGAFYVLSMCLAISTGVFLQEVITLCKKAGKTNV